MQPVEEIYKSLLQPSDDLIQDIAKLEGDIMILGVGGKMGPALAKLAKQAVEKTGIKKRIIGVARFTEKGLQEELEKEGIETIKADLLNDDQLQELPEIKNVLYLAGVKFGTSGNESFTWAMNAYLPGRVAEKFKHSRIVVFSTGNVYPLTHANGKGANENVLPEPLGEYAQSCLGRERIFQYFSEKNNTPILIYRLNYANDVSYGVLLEIAKAVKENRPIDLSMGTVNVIWQGDANEIALRCLHYCSVPGKILNVTGNEILSVRKLAETFGEMFNTKPIFINEEQPTSLLSDASECSKIFGTPKISLQQMMDVIVQWINHGGKTINKPTHFSERKGKY